MSAIDREFLELLGFKLDKIAAKLAAFQCKMRSKTIDEINSEDTQLVARDVNFLVQEALLRCSYAVDMDRICEFVKKHYDDNVTSDFLELFKSHNCDSLSDWLGSHKRNIVQPNQLPDFFEGAARVSILFTNLDGFLFNNKSSERALKAATHQFDGKLEYFVQNFDQARTLSSSFSRAHLPVVIEESSEIYAGKNTGEVLLFEYADGRVRALVSNNQDSFNECEEMRAFSIFRSVGNSRMYDEPGAAVRTGEFRANYITRWDAKEQTVTYGLSKANTSRVNPYI